MLKKEMLLACARKTIYESTITCGYYTASKIKAYGYINGSNTGAVTGYRNNSGEYYPRLLSFYYNESQKSLSMDFDDAYQPSGENTLMMDIYDDNNVYPNVVFPWGSVDGGRDRFVINLNDTTYPTLAQVQEMFKTGNTIKLYYHVHDLD